ncbi:hypothetical protein NST41_33860 [Paenibacillus sp. FSL L8-0696]|uniref:hypothetical protein n=1 Tax=Paenibacillus sp. FSL L8-0696 TaxID=2954524 RepID=UPI0031195315
MPRLMLPLTIRSLAAATHALLDAIQRPGPATTGASISSSLMCLQEPDLSIALPNCYRSPLDPLQLLLTLSWMRSIAQDQLPLAHRSGVQQLTYVSAGSGSEHCPG